MQLPPQNRSAPASLLLRAAVALVFLVAVCVPARSVAQRHGGGGPGGGFGGGMPGGGPTGHEMGGGMGSRNGGDFGRPDMSRNNSEGMHGGLQLGPPSRWWDDKHFARQLRLTSDQQHHMDAIFEQSRPVLLKRLETLQQEEQRMEVLAHAKTLDEAALFTQIDRIEQARADLFKANTHYLVQLRNELDQDQISKLSDQH